MPFGSFMAQERTGRSDGKKGPAPRKSGAPQSKATVQPPAEGGLKFHILLVGRNLSIVQEFLCSMNQNIGEALGREGMSYYTRELEAILDIVAKKKQLEQFFWTFSPNDWEYPEDEMADKNYIFSISPSGNQSQALDFEFRCVTPDFESRISWEQTDAVWFLTDGLLLSDRAGSDPYIHWIRDVLSHIPEQAQGRDKPICLILSQIEKLGRFDGPGEISVLPDKLSQKLTALCQEYFSDACSIPVAVLPVQVYGGLECVGMDGKGNPVLHISPSGFYQTYIPDNCQIPGLYTLQAIASARQTDYFADIPGGSLLKGIRHHYGVKFGNPAWAPTILERQGGI